MPDPANAIEKYFFDKLTSGGLDLVTAESVDKLFEYAEKNEVTAEGVVPVADGETGEVDAFERGAIEHLLLNEEWRRMLSDDGIVRLEERLGVQSTQPRAGVGRDAPGTVPFGSIESNLTSYIGAPQVGLKNLTALFNHEYNSRARVLFENPRIDEDERSKKILFLLQDYAKVLKRAGSGAEVANQRRELLKAFFEKPLAAEYGAADPDDDLLNNAWEIVWGTNPEKAETTFEIDRDRSWSAYMSMRGEFIDTAEKIDAYLEAQGKTAKVAEFEKKSPLNWIIGEQPGNTKPGSMFYEERAISTTGVNFALKLLNDESAVGARTLDPTFDMRVDFYAWNNFVRLAPGDSLVPLHAGILLEGVDGENKHVELADIQIVRRAPLPDELSMVLPGGDTRVVALADVAEVRRREPAAGADPRPPRDTIVLKDGTEIAGELKTLMSFAGVEPKEDGTFLLAHTDEGSAVVAGLEAGRDTIVLIGGKEIPGSLLTGLSFDGAEDQDGTLVLHNTDAKPLVKELPALEVKIEEVGDQHWRPIFLDANGNRIDPSVVSSVIKDSSGKVKGDGKVSGTYSASWWGYCDRNAMEGLVTMKYGMPKPDMAVTLKVGDQEFTFNRNDIVDIVGRRLSEIFPRQTQAGSRFDEEPDQIYLQNGNVLVGKIKTSVEFYRPDTYRQGDNMVVVPGQADGPRGSLLMKTADGEQDVQVLDIVEIRRAPSEGTGSSTNDVIVLADGTEIAGSLLSNFSFAGAEERDDGTLVVKNSDNEPLFGDIRFTTKRGEDKRIALSNIKLMVREDENEVLADEALAYVIRNRGIFAADSWTGSSVANGTRTIEEIMRWKVGDPEKPSWVPDKLDELKGYRGKVMNPDNVLFFRMGNKGSTYGGMKFWIEVDANGMPINSTIFSGQWDFLWGVEGEPEWSAKPTFNPHVPNELVLTLYINSLENPEEFESVLPDNWRDYLMEPAPESPPEPTPPQ